MSKTFVRFFTIADYEEEEVWLRKQHQKGWKVRKMIPPCFYVFDECEPEDVIYRLDYKDSKDNEDYIPMLNDFGWEYVMKYGGWLYFRKSADMAESEQDGELFSDDASRVELVQHVVKRHLIPFAFVFLCCVIPNFIQVVDGGYIGGLRVFFGIFWSVMFVLYVFLIVYCEQS